MLLEEMISRTVKCISFEDLDDDLLHTLKRNILDSYAGICASLRDESMLRKFQRLTSDSASGSDVVVWGIDKRTGIADAIFMNSIMGRRSDLLNSFLAPNGQGGVHPSDNVAMVLTMADWMTMNGRSFLSTIYVAIYLSLALGTYYSPQVAMFDHDASAPFWTALTIGYAMGLTEEQLTDAQRIVGMLGLDINQASYGSLTDWRHCTFASSAVKGLQAVRLTLAGIQGPSEIYEGEAGVDLFFPHTGTMFVPPPNLSRIIFKRWPAFTFCQTPIDVALELANRIPDPQTVTSIDVRTYSLAFKYGAIPSASHPDTRAGRTHSIPYCIAAALIKPIEYGDFDDGYSKDATLNMLISKVKVVEDPQMTKAFPGKSQCSIKVTLEDGTTLNSSRDFPKGDPLDPLSDKELEHKFRINYFLDGSDGEKSEIINCIWNIEREKNLDRLLAPLKRSRI